MSETKKQYSSDEIVAMLSASNYAVERALLRLYERQTSTEQSSERTEDRNGVGFSAFDAEIFSSFAKQILTNPRGYANGQRLSPGQLHVCRKLDKRGHMKIAKYARQLAAIANES
jgi:hypothetical protein